MTACSSNEVPINWRDVKLPTAGFVRIEDGSNSNGLYVEYRDVSREELLSQVSSALLAAGYARHSEVLDGKVLGFVRGSTQVAVKVDGGDTSFLSLFTENGVDPLLHGVVFGRYTLGSPVTGIDARNMLLKELGQEEGNSD